MHTRHISVYTLRVYQETWSTVVSDHSDPAEYMRKYGLAAGELTVHVENDILDLRSLSVLRHLKYL